MASPADDGGGPDQKPPTPAWAPPGAPTAEPERAWRDEAAPAPTSPPAMWPPPPGTAPPGTGPPAPPGPPASPPMWPPPPGQLQTQQQTWPPPPSGPGGGWGQPPVLPKAGSSRTGPLPLHPMTVSDVLDGAFKLLKANAH